MTPWRHRRARMRGLLLPAVLFVIVVVGAIVAALALLAQRGAGAVALEVAGARALAAAQAGAEWAAWQVRDPAGTRAPLPTALPDCPASPTTLSLPAPLDAFDVAVSCRRLPATGAFDEGGLRSVIYEITAVASAGDAAAADRVERRVQLRVETCRNPAASVPTPC